MPEYSLKVYVAKKALVILPTLLAIVTLSFLLIQFAPGDPVAMLAGDGADPAYYPFIREQFGLDRPMHVQYFSYLSNWIQGNLGYSWTFRRPVLQVIGDAFPNSIILILSAMCFASTLGVLLGITASRKQYSRADNIISTLTILWGAIPVFWLGQMLILLFAINLHLFPALGMAPMRSQPTGIDYVLAVSYHLVLPSITLGALHTAVATRLTRTSMLEVMRENFILTARSKGLEERSVLFRHALPNAILPVFTVMALRVATMFAGATITETVFSWPGLGRLMFQSVQARDYPMLLGIFTLVSMAVVIITALTDIVYAIIDPRIRLVKE